MTRPRINENREGGLYFGRARTDLKFIPTGSKLLDLALGGGWAQTRMANIVGDKSTGKTLLVIEGSANFARLYPNGKEDIFYREREHAFLPDYARAIGMPMERVQNWDKKRNELKHPVHTVEDMFDDLQEIIKFNKGRRGGPVPVFYAVDSLDSLSDDAELERGIREGSYGTGKAKGMSEIFRRLAGPLEENNITVIIVSQVRQKIGVVYGRKEKRGSGGKSVDFYMSQVVWLTELDKIKKKVGGIERVTGVNIRALVDKNKVGQSYRSVKFPIMFGYGIDDVPSCIDFLKEAKSLDYFFTNKNPDIDRYLEKFEDMASANRKVEVAELHAAIAKRWWEIEKALLPTHRKYD